MQPEIILTEDNDVTGPFSKGTSEHKDAKHMTFKVKAERTFCGGFSGALVPFSPQRAKRVQSSIHVGKRNRVFADVNPVGDDD